MFLTFFPSLFYTIQLCTSFVSISNDLCVVISEAYHTRRRLAITYKSVHYHLRPVLLQEYFGTNSGTISSTTNSTRIVPETSEKNGVFWGGFRCYFGTICGTISSMCSRLVTNTRRAPVCVFLQDACRSCHPCCPCRLLPLTPAAAIIASFSTAAFNWLLFLLPLSLSPPPLSLFLLSLPLSPHHCCCCCHCHHHRHYIRQNRCCRHWRLCRCCRCRFFHCSF